MVAIKKINIKGFKSIRALEDFELKPLNIIVGANGSGKSNLIQVFRMLMAMANKNFQNFIQLNGQYNSFPFNGFKVTPQIDIGFEFQPNSQFSEETYYYRFSMIPSAQEQFFLSEERRYMKYNWKLYGAYSPESRLADEKDERSINEQSHGVGFYVYDAIVNWMVYHFHDTSVNAAMRLSSGTEDYRQLRGYGENIAACLYHLRYCYHKYSQNHVWHAEAKSYSDIIHAIRLVLPFFDDFLFDTMKVGEAEKVKLSWRQVGSDYPMQPYHLSDGSIRFICLATALLQPYLPTTIVIDEPELGLHPEAINVLAELLKLAATRTQVIVATQSPLLLDQFGIEDIIVARRQNGASTFARLKEADYANWLEEYTIGELWTKNVIEGGTVHE